MTRQELLIKFNSTLSKNERPNFFNPTEQFVEEVRQGKGISINSVWRSACGMYVIFKYPLSINIPHRKKCLHLDFGFYSL